mmetsp:Transcript_24400/g.60227  ORF Transcript_24400/g.60227 Transcript_24400/m.60227 type:complete len:248 (+) Transcript_24400:1252-1995(+)
MNVSGSVVSMGTSRAYPDASYVCSQPLLPPTPDDFLAVFAVTNLFGDAQPRPFEKQSLGRLNSKSRSSAIIELLSTYGEPHCVATSLRPFLLQSSFFTRCCLKRIRPTGAWYRLMKLSSSNKTNGSVVLSQSHTCIGRRTVLKDCVRMPCCGRYCEVTNWSRTACVTQYVSPGGFCRKNRDVDRAMSRAITHRSRSLTVAKWAVLLSSCRVHKSCSPGNFSRRFLVSFSSSCCSCCSLFLLSSSSWP